MLGKVIAISSAVSITLLIALLQNTTPSTIGPLGILLVFILMYVSVLGALTFLLCGGSRIIGYVALSFGISKVGNLTLNRSYYFCSIIALAPVMLVAMQSVGEITFYDVSLVTIFTILGCVYVSKRVTK